MVTLAWALTVGVTGVISALSDLVIAAWRNDSLAAMVAPYRDAPPLTERAPATHLLTIAEQAAPGMRPDFIAFPGTRFSSEHHYAVFMKGATHLTSHLLTPVLIDARTLAVTAVGERPGTWMPWACRNRCTSVTTVAGQCKSCGRYSMC